MAQVFDTLGLDPTLPDVVLKIGGKERHLAFDYRAIIMAEKVAGINLLSETFENISFTSIAGLLYAALLKDDPSLTLEEVGSWIHFSNAPVIYQAILAAWLGSVPKAEEGATGEAAAQTHE